MKHQKIKASLTVEAALVMPLFIYFIMAFLYIIQIFTIQEQIQDAITEMGMSLAKYSYICTEVIDNEEAMENNLLNLEDINNLQEIAGTAFNGSLLKYYFQKYIDIEEINKSCIKDGYEGVNFSCSEILDNMDDIDVVVRYKVKIPISLLGLDEMQMIQRVKLRGWTGYQVPTNYTVAEENENTEDTIVYITKTGSVYHTDRECSHIKLSVRSVIGIPTALRNDNGAKYKPCEVCDGTNHSNTGIYYITSEGTRYHSRSTCSKIKRTVIEVRLSQIVGRRLCKRCANN